MNYKEISGNHYELQNGNGKTIGRIKCELFETNKVLHGIPVGEWAFVLYRVDNGEDIKIPAPQISTLNQAKAALEYHFRNLIDA